MSSLLNHDQLCHLMKNKTTMRYSRLLLPEELRKRVKDYAFTYCYHLRSIKENYAKTTQRIGR